MSFRTPCSEETTARIAASTRVTRRQVPEEQGVGNRYLSAPQHPCSWQERVRRPITGEPYRPG